jgi:hypothetical protein
MHDADACAGAGAYGGGVLRRANEVNAQYSTGTRSAEAHRERVLQRRYHCRT